LLGVSLGSRAQTIPAQARITAPVDEAVLTRLAGNTHPLARPEFDQGAAPPDLPMDRMLLVLKRSPDQESTLQALLDQQHDKSSANYHQWLTPDQFGQQFGPADQDIRAVTSWLQSHGFQVARVGRGRTAIEFSGTAAQVRDAFRTEIHSYLVGGAQHWANGSDPQIPAALAPVVSGVAALHNFPMKPLLHLAGTFSKTIATGEVKPLGLPAVSAEPKLAAPNPQFTFSGSLCQPTCYALGPYDFGTIYNVLPLWAGTGGGPVIDGSGQNIAVVGESNINLQDVRDFRSMFGLPANDPQILVDGPDPGVIPSDLETEALLDVEWAGAVAPGAKIEFITSASTNTAAGVDLSAFYAVDNNVAPVLSVSFGACELFLESAGNQFHSALWEQAAAQGITVAVATGDSGSAVCDRFTGTTPEPAQLGLAVSGLASTPFNVAVGGTDFLNFGPSFVVNSPSPYWNSTNNPGAHQSSAMGYIPESTWDSSCTNQGFPFLRWENTPEGRCNDSLLHDLVDTEGGSGGKSNCISASGFVPSDCSGGYARPAWQTTALNDNARDLPDVSFFASDGFWGSFYIVCEADALPLNPSCSLQNGFANFIGVGGTSAAAPAFAGMMALVNQATNSNGQGNANYELYKLPSLPSQAGLNCDATNPPDSRCIFNDVTFGTITMPCAAGSTPDCTVSLGGDKYGVLSGYDAGAGYDRATGLGSVNASNLVRSWSQVTFNSTSTTLTLEGTSSGTVSTPIPHGTLVPVAVTVTKNASGVAGTPTGDVSLVATSVNGEGVDGRTLSSGMATWQTNQLPGGSYSVHAHYAGDGTFGASDSVPVAVTVSRETSTTTLSAFTASGALPAGVAVPYGSTVYLRADVKSATNTNDTPPTGTATFIDTYNGTQMAPTAYMLNSQGTAIAGNGLCTLSPGTHSFTASYSGDNSYTSSGPASAPTFTVNQATTQVGGLPPRIVAINSTFVLILFVSGSNSLHPLGSPYCAPALPTGMVSLSDGSTSLGSVALGGSSSISTFPGGQAVAVFNLSATSPLQLGSNTLTASYSGDSNYLSASGTIIVLVGYPTTTVLTSSNLAVPVSTNVTFTAQVTSSQSGGQPITGNVVFQVDRTPSTTVPVVNGNAQFTTSFPSATPSSHQITAQYLGDQNYVPSRGSLQEQVVTPDFTLSDSLGSAGNIVIGSPGQSSAPVTLTVTGTNGYNGTIAFSPGSCVITPAGSLSSCNFSPSSVTGSGSTQLVINTTGPRAAGTLTGHFVFRGTKLQPIAVCLLFLVTLTIFRKQRRLNLIFGSVILLALFGLWACGGGSNGGNGGATTSANTIPGTPTGVPYTATINAAPSGENGHTISLTFTVQ
jgi:hypothetical protein